jgi:hypothetical protein
MAANPLLSGPRNQMIPVIGMLGIPSNLGIQKFRKPSFIECFVESIKRAIHRQLMVGVPCQFRCTPDKVLEPHLT